MPTKNPGAWVAAARTIGVTLEEYAAQRHSGRKWCYACCEFVPRAFFRCNATQHDGLGSECNSCHARNKQKRTRRR